MDYDQQIYIANNDTGNMQYYQVPPNGKWKQIYQDLDITFYSFDTLALRMDQTAGSDIFNALLKQRLAEQVYRTFRGR